MLLLVEVVSLLITAVNYSSMFHLYPISTTLLMNSILSAISDTLAQMISNYKSDKDKHKKTYFDNIEEKGQDGFKSKDIFDIYRTFTFVIWGLIAGTSQIYWYEWLHQQFEDNVIFRVLADQIIYAPISIAGMFIYNNYIQDFGDMTTLKKKFKNIFIYTLICNYLLWPAVQLCNFKFVPLHFQVPFGCFIGIFWNCFVCLTQH